MNVDCFNNQLGNINDFQCFEESFLKPNKDFIEMPMAKHYEQPGVHAKNFQPISQQ